MPPDDWPGVGEFRDLGTLARKVELNGEIVVGFFKMDETGLCYAASTRPRVVGMGHGESGALADWFDELVDKWQMAKTLRRPFAPAIENDVEAMGKFFGTLSNDSRDSQDSPRADDQGV